MVSVLSGQHTMDPIFSLLKQMPLGMVMFCGTGENSREWHIRVPRVD